MRAHYALSLLFSLSALGSMAQPANDACADAIPVACGNTYTGTTTNATDDIALNCGTNVTAAGVWYLLLGSNQQVTLSTCVGTDYDTRLNVYTGSCGAFTCVTGNDDACDLQSSVSFVALEDVSYYVLVQGYNGLTGNFTLAVECGPITEDNCQGALPIACGQTVSGSTTGATIDGAPECDTGIQAAGEWYTFSGVQAQVTLSTCPGSGYDTRLNVYRGSCAELVCVVGNDDAPGVLCSEVIFDATASDTYYVLVQGYDGQTGSYELTMTCSNCPAPTNVSVSALDTNAEVAWDSGVEGTTFFVEYGPSEFTPGTGTVISGITGTDGPPVYFDGLELGTAYQVYITQSCGKEESTTGPIGFITLSEPLAPNAACNGAIAIACGQNVQGNTTLGLQSRCAHLRLGRYHHPRPVVHLYRHRRGGDPEHLRQHHLRHQDQCVHRHLRGLHLRGRQRRCPRLHRQQQRGHLPQHQRHHLLRVRAWIWRCTGRLQPGHDLRPRLHAGGQ